MTRIFAHSDGPLREQISVHSDAATATFVTVTLSGKGVEVGGEEAGLVSVQRRVA